MSDPPGSESIDFFTVNPSWLLLRVGEHVSVQSLMTGEMHELAVSDISGDPRLNGDNVAWIETSADGTGKIVLADLRSGITSEVATISGIATACSGLIWSGDSLIWTEVREDQGVYCILDTQTGIQTEHALTTGDHRSPMLVGMALNRIFSINLSSSGDRNLGDQRFGYLDTKSGRFTGVTRSDNIPASQQAVTSAQVTNGFVFWIDVSRQLWFAPTESADRHEAINYALMDSFVELTLSSDGTLIATHRSGKNGTCTLSLITATMLKKRAELSSDWEYAE